MEEVLIFTNSKLSNVIQNFSTETKSEEPLTYNYSSNKVQSLTFKRLRKPKFYLE